MTRIASLPICSDLAPTGPAEDEIHLDYEARFLRRKRLTTDKGLDFLVDFPETRSLDDGQILVLDTGQRIAVRAAKEPVLEITGDLPRLAWHIGNRHTPCQIFATHLRIRDDHVLAAMLRKLGAQVMPRVAVFTPERGAYGHGRTLAHSHGPGDHDHAP
ncbi:MAG: urease accessory protein UreE [Qingshengfaniella sp.]